MRRWPQLSIILLAVSAWLLASSQLPPTGYTGGFGERNCTACHGGADVNSGPGSFRIEGIPAQYTPGATIPITITLSQAGQRRWGFELAARSRANGAQAGSFAATSADIAVRVTNNVLYVAQTFAGVRDGVTGGPVSWTVNWTAPTTDAGEILFTAAGLAANGDGTVSGDYTYTTQVSTNPVGQIPSPLPTKQQLSILAHMVKGGGFVTRIFLTNLTPSVNQVLINIVGKDGRVAESWPVTMPVGGSYLYSTLESNRFAPESEVRWVAIGADAPLAVSLLYDLRNPVTHDLQAAIAVYESQQFTICTAPFLFRSDGVTLGLAVVNLTGGDNTLTLKLLDREGNILANDSLKLDPFAQTAFVVSERPAFNSVLQGQTEFLGSVTVMGTQRFAAVAIGAEGGELFAVPLTSGAAR